MECQRETSSTAATSPGSPSRSSRRTGTTAQSSRKASPHPQPSGSQHPPRQRVVPSLMDEPSGVRSQEQHEQLGSPRAPAGEEEPPCHDPRVAEDEEVDGDDDEEAHMGSRANLRQPVTQGISRLSSRASRSMRSCRTAMIRGLRPAGRMWKM